MPRSTSDAPSSRKVACGSATYPGVLTPARASRVLAMGLSKASRADAPVEPTYGSPIEVSTSRKAPSSPAAPCSNGMTQLGRCLRSASMSDTSTSASRTSSSVLRRRASATRRPDRSETSRSGERPPESTRYEDIDSIPSRSARKPLVLLEIWSRDIRSWRV